MSKSTKIQKKEQELQDQTKARSSFLESLYYQNQKQKPNTNPPSTPTKTTFRGYIRDLRNDIQQSSQKIVQIATETIEGLKKGAENLRNRIRFNSRRELTW